MIFEGGNFRRRASFLGIPYTTVLFDYTNGTMYVQVVSDYQILRWKGFLGTYKQSRYFLFFTINIYHTSHIIYLDMACTKALSSNPVFLNMNCLAVS